MRPIWLFVCSGCVVIERVIILRSGRFKSSWVEETVRSLERSAVVVHPTETIHGLGCRYDSSSGLERISRLKRRRPDKPMIFLVPGTAWLENLCGEIPRLAARLAGLFWPGPLTLVLKTSDEARKKVPWLGETVAVRRCAHPFTARVLSELNLPIASTSLNFSGRPVEPDPERSLELLAPGWQEEPRLRPDLAVIDKRQVAKEKTLPSTILAVKPKGEMRLIRRGACPLSEIFTRTGIEPTAVEPG